MREVKFRVWDRIEKEFLDIQLGNYDYFFGWTVQHDGSRSPDHCIFMQFTGLKDKNGTDIYEGDVFHCNKVNYVLRFNQIGGAYTVHKIGDEKDERFLFHCNDQIEVIGNIHENPELITQHKN